MLSASLWPLAAFFVIFALMSLSVKNFPNFFQPCLIYVIPCLIYIIAYTVFQLQSQHIFNFFFVLLWQPYVLNISFPLWWQCSKLQSLTYLQFLFNFVKSCSYLFWTLHSKTLLMVPNSFPWFTLVNAFDAQVSI